MLPVTPQMQSMIDQKVQTPICAVVVQTATPDGSKPATQTYLRKVLSYQVTRTEDAQSDVCKLTFADDNAEYFSSNSGGAYSAIFAPGVIDNKVMVYLGLEGCAFPNTSNFSAYNRQLLLKFTGTIESDANADQQFSLTKTLSLIDLTKQFRFPVNDTYPHPLYGDQTVAYFDPTYNLKPFNVSNGQASIWVCDGKMFTESSADLVYGSTHSAAMAYIDTTGGQNPQHTPYGDVSNYTISNHIGIASNYQFDYRAGVLTLSTPIPSNSVVSMSGNPTYMAPEVMIRKILVELANWSPNFLNLDPTNVLLPMYKGNGDSAWTVLQKIASLTSPRFTPWQIWADENGVINFYEQRYDGPPRKTFIEGKNIITGNYENTSRQLRTVVRADGQVPVTNAGQLSDQQVSSIAYNVKSINKYGLTEPLELDQAITQNVASMPPTQAINDLNMYTAAVLAQVSRPILTCQAEIWPDPSIQPGDKLAIRNTRLGLTKEWIVKETDEASTQKVHSHNLTLQEFYDSVNFSIGAPAAVTSYANISTPSTTPPPSISLIGAVRLGNGSNQRYSVLDGDIVCDDADMPVIPIWDATDNSNPMHFDIFFNSLPGAGQTVNTSGNQPPKTWNNKRLPPGFGWVGTKDKAGNEVYYGTDPATGYTSFVGPDGVFYRFNHAQPIQDGDFGTSAFAPNGSVTSPPNGGTQTYTGQTTSVYVWSWFYLCLDSNLAVQNAQNVYMPTENFGKFYRPVMRVNPTQDAQAISVGATGGYWLKQNWSLPPVPSATASVYTYGNLAVGISDYTGTPTGFVGANVMNDGINVGVAYGNAAPSGVIYTQFQKTTKGYYNIFAMNSQGQRQFLRVPFQLVL